MEEPEHPDRPDRLVLLDSLDSLVPEDLVVQPVHQAVEALMVYRELRDRREKMVHLDLEVQLEDKVFRV